MKVESAPISRRLLREEGHPPGQLIADLNGCPQDRGKTKHLVGDLLRGLTKYALIGRSVRPGRQALRDRSNASLLASKRNAEGPVSRAFLCSAGLQLDFLAPPDLGISAIWIPIAIDVPVTAACFGT